MNNVTTHSMNMTENQDDNHNPRKQKESRKAGGAVGETCR